jgi:TonB family protein
VLHLVALHVLNIDAVPPPAVAGLQTGNAAAVTVRVLPQWREGATPLFVQARPVAPPSSEHRVTKAPQPPISATAPMGTGVQVEPHPRSAPDLEQLHGLAFSGLPMRIRLLIDDQGRVTQVKVIETSDADDVTEAVLRVFEQTAFVPARRNGKDVASQFDIELNFGS